MALITAKATGNWSAGSTWDSDPALPGAGDTVECANYTVTIDQNVTVVKIQSSAAGYFTCAGAYTITADVESVAGHSGGGVLRFTNSTGVTAALIGNVSGVGVANQGIVSKLSGSGALNITGNITSGTAINSRGLMFSVTSAAAVVTVTGNVAGGPNAGGWYSIGAYNADIGTLTITGNATGGAADSNYGAQNNSTGTVEVQGFCAGGTYKGAFGAFNNNSAGVLKVHKLEFNLEAAVSGKVVIVPSSATNEIKIPKSTDGTDLSMSWDYPAVANVADGIFYALGTLEGTLAGGACDYPAETDVRDGVMFDIYTGSLDLPAVADVQSGVTFDGATKTGTFVSPAVGDVQAAVTYGAAAEYTGTLALPTEAQVESGVGFGAGGTEFTGALVGGSDWTADEKKQIRQALGITGTTAVTTGTGTLEAAFTALADDAEIAAAVLVAMNAAPPAVNVTYRAGIAVAAADDYGNDPVNVKRWRDFQPQPLDSGGNVLTNAQTLDSQAQQDVRDAMLLAPTAGDPAAGSVDKHLDDILEDTSTTLPAQIAICASVVANNTDATAAGSITRRRGDSWSIALTLGAITGWTSLWFTVKSNHDDADTAAILQVKLNATGLLDGLLYVNGAAANDALGSITVSDASTGAIIVAVDETITDDLTPGEYVYDAQALISGNVTTPDSGTFAVTSDVTRSVT